MTIFDSLLLGIIQGLTEFLPISSSGHLILMREVLGINTQGGLTFDAILQLGTILAVFVYFRKLVLELIRDAVRYLIGQGKKVKKENRMLILALIFGTIPAAALGFFLEDVMETVFRSALLVAVTLIAGSLLFVAAERLAKQKFENVSPKQGWWIGCFQLLALIPGVSRSGATISGGLLLGINRVTAARFSFLLALPIITGSGLKKLLDVYQFGIVDVSALHLTLGFVSAFVVGLICIHYLLKYLKNHTLYAFVWYRLALAAIVLIAYIYY
ncbi:MAG: undecaprenyl-diphosphatase UppP [Patescibacteria group bacterium]|nr:undecaprenyl-diphosphatase UppP [Patescibacteria group bacterium]MBU2509347.1 undecaprenyl-diphosphatase UppP [Patescibacteria group bacterium]